MKRSKKDKEFEQVKEFVEEHDTITPEIKIEDFLVADDLEEIHEEDEYSGDFDD